MYRLALSEVSIILVEPSDTQCKIIIKQLAAADIHHVEAVGNVKQAIEEITKNGADLVVSAMYFEDGTGLDIIKYIKNDESFAATQFMLVSSENRVEKLEKAAQISETKNREKYIELEKLRAKLKAAGIEI